MISTVTTSTITTITTMADFGAMLGGVAAGTLVALLCARELAAAAGCRTPRLLPGSLNVSTVPLVMVFAATVIIQVLNIVA